MSDEIKHLELCLATATDILIQVGKRQLIIFANVDV